MRAKLFAIVVAAASFSLPAYRQLSTTFDGTLGIVLASVEKHSEHHEGVHPHGNGGHPNEIQPHGSHPTEGHGNGSHATEGHAEGEHHIQHTIVVTEPVIKDVKVIQQYVCQIHSCRHIDVCPLERGYLQEIPINEGQTVKEGDLLFTILPTLYQAKRDADLAEAQLAQVEYDNTKKLVEQNIVSNQELKLAQAKLAKAQAEAKVAQSELDFTEIRAPFDGIVDRLHEQQGSFIEEGDVLTTLSDNTVMWVYFNVPERAYLDFQEQQAQHDLKIELKLANEKLFPHSGEIGAIEADFNNETGNIAFRADFPNPDGLLRHGQTGTVLISHALNNSLVIPQRASFEILDKRYVFVVDEDDVVHQRPIVIQEELEDIYVISDGLEADEKIILDGIRQVRDSETVEYEFRDPHEVLGDLKHEAE